MSDEFDLDDEDENEDEAVEGQAGRVLSNRQVLAFIAGFWFRRRGLLVGSVGLTLVAIGFDLAMPWAAGALVDAVAAGPEAADGVWLAWATFVGIYLAYVVSQNMSFRFWIPLAARNMEEMTNEGFGQVQGFSADWHANTFAGATVRRLSRAMWGYDAVSDAVVLWLGPALVVLFGLSAMMVLRWPSVGYFALATVVLYIVSNSVLTTRYARPANLKSVALDSELGAALSDAVTANPTVKSFGAEAREQARLADVTRRWRLAVRVTWTRFVNIWLVQNLLLVALQAGLTGLVLRLWSQGQAGAGDVAFAITSFMLMSGYLRHLGENIRDMQKGLDDAEDVARYATMAPQVADRPGAAAFRPGRGEIVFDRATFRYATIEAPLYSDFSLKIAPGERVALVGPTGSGKSTFVKLVQRLYDLQGGRILIDGQDIAEVTQGSLRRAIAVVPQDPALFHRTIAENIAYARPDATTDEIEQVARRARAHDFIRRLPKGYQTLVGERGVKLSGGERQRVAIARAFLADAPILVLDEATSSLDVETERDVQAAMEALMVGRTTVVIAHRLSTIRGADRILVFDHGRVVEEGRHGELVRRGGTYARLNAVAEGVGVL
jgi:ATP-binding cassette subfamily B protein